MNSKIIISVIFVLVIICGVVVFFLYKDQILGSEKSKIKRGTCGQIKETTDCGTSNVFREDDFECKGKKCKTVECCAMKGVCISNVCDNNQVLKSDPPACATDLCTQKECCESKDTCSNNPGICSSGDSYLLKQTTPEYNSNYDIDECCDRSPCFEYVCSDTHYKKDILPRDCIDGICTTEQCCTPKPTCDTITCPSDSHLGYINPLPANCDSRDRDFR